MIFMVHFKEKIFTGEPGEEASFDADFSTVGGWDERIEAKNAFGAVDEADARCRRYEERAKAKGETIKVSCEVEFRI